MSSRRARSGPSVITSSSVSPTSILNTFYAKVTPLVDRLNTLVALSTGTLAGPVPSDISGANGFFASMETEDSNEPQASTIRPEFYRLVNRAQRALEKLEDNDERRTVMALIGRPGDVSDATDPAAMSAAANFERLTRDLNYLRAILDDTLSDVRDGNAVAEWKVPQA